MSSNMKSMSLVREELRAIFSHHLIWLTLGNQDIKLRYRRSSLGPFWITLSMMVTIYSMGFLYGHLFKMDLNIYFPYLASGIICWSFFSTIILESSNVFIESEGYIRNQESTISLFNMRLILRNIIIFLHNLLVFIPIIIFFHIKIGFYTLFIIPGLLIIVINAIFWGTLLGIIGTRYRDFSQIITSLIQVIFFVTPIMWMPTLLPEKYRWVIKGNPFNQFLDLIRNPLLNEPFSTLGFVEVILITLSGFILYSYFIKKYKSRIVFWL